MSRGSEDMQEEKVFQKRAPQAKVRVVAGLGRG